jgi:hemerythrin-like domain-containing protein
MMDRRHLIGLSTGMVSGLAATALAEVPGAGSAAQASSSASGVLITPPEDLMREHGVLKRVLLIFRESIRVIDHGGSVPRQEVEAGARIIREFIQGYHELLEERYIFPRLAHAGVATGTVTELHVQHGCGRMLISRVLAAVSKPRHLNARGRQRLAGMLRAFVHMYEPHEAREDTVIYPAFRQLVSNSEFVELAEIIHEQGERRFGPTGFHDFVDRCAGIEKRLGIYDLSKFTAHPHP